MKFHRVTCENNLFKYLKLKLEFEKRKEKDQSFRDEFVLFSSFERRSFFRFTQLFSCYRRTVDFYHENNRIKIDEEIILRKDSERKRLRISLINFSIPFSKYFNQWFDSIKQKFKKFLELKKRGESWWPFDS